MHVLEARRAFDKALQLDPGSVEANLYRVYMLLSRGEKESARHGIENLLQTAGNDWNVRMVAGITLRIDGMYEEALDQFNASLRMNPSNAAMIYNHRARVYQYQNQLELAGDEIEKGLTLEPTSRSCESPSATSRCAQATFPKPSRLSRTSSATKSPSASSSRPSPLCYVQLGDREKAATFIIDETLAAAEADSEMAYRLATYFARRRRRIRSAPLAPPRHLPRQRKLPMVRQKPRLAKTLRPRRLRAHPRRPEKVYRRNQKNWKRLLAQVRD